MYLPRGKYLRRECTNNDAAGLVLRAGFKVMRTHHASPEPAERGGVNSHAQRERGAFALSIYILCSAHPLSSVGRRYRGARRCSCLYTAVGCRLTVHMCF